MKQSDEFMKNINLPMVHNSILRNTNLSTSAKVVYALLVAYAWHNGSCFPAQKRLAKDVGLSRPRVTQLVGELEQFGLVTIQRQGQGKPNLYSIHFKVRRRAAPPDVGSPPC